MNTYNSLEVLGPNHILFQFQNYLTDLKLNVTSQEPNAGFF